MKSLKKQRRIQVIVAAFIALAMSAALIGTAFKDGINLYRSPSEVIAEPPNPSEVFKVGGLVVEGSIKPDVGQKFFFSVTDTNATVDVYYIGNDPRPDLFEEGQSTIATGKFIDGLFEATEILAKHDETYMPKEIIDDLKEQGVYVEPTTE